MLVSFFFIIRSLYAMRADIGQLDNLAYILALCGVFALLFVTAVYALGLSFRFILAFLSNRKLGFWEPLAVYTRANLCKYLPGNVMHLVARNVYAKKLNISQSQMAFGSLLDILFSAGLTFLFCAIFAGRLFFVLLGRYLPWGWYLLGGFALLFILAALLWIFRKTKRLTAWRESFLVQMRQMKAGALARLSLKLTGVLMFFHLVAGLMFFFLLQTIAPVQDTNLLLVLPAYMMAWLLGYITPGAPGGLGVKEAILTLMLADVYGAAAVLVAALLFRGVTITADVLAFCFIRLATNLTKRKGHA